MTRFVGDVEVFGPLRFSLGLFAFVRYNFADGFYDTPTGNA
jgi:hypothetical protein